MFIGFDQHTTSEHLLSAVIEKLCEAGHSIHIIQKDTGGDLPSIPKILEKYEVTTDVIPFVSADKVKFFKRYKAELRYIENCKKYIISDYDAVFIQSTNVAGFAVKTIRKKLPKAIITYNVQDIFPYNLAYAGGIKKDGLIFKIMAAEQRYAYKHADHIITISEDMKELLVEDGIPSDKIEVVYNWSYQDDPYDYADLDLTVANKLFDKNYFNVVYAGNIGVMQNVDILIETAALMKDKKDIWFHIIGNGVYKDKLIKKADELEIENITFWPMQPPEVAAAIYSSADVNVIPLVKNVYRTALPSKTATCLACKKPVILAIGETSIFAKKIAEHTSCQVIGTDNSEELKGAILNVKHYPQDDESAEFYLQSFQKTENSRKYAEIISR